MLRELSLQDFVIVRDLNLLLDSGLTVFTGETGAGKSILIDALSLVLGGRISSSVVRPGANRAQITAVFEATAASQQWLKDNDLEVSDDTLILRRVVDTQGKARTYINAAPCTVTQLRELGERLVDIHGQHAYQSLIKPDSQRDLLDAFANLTTVRQQATTHWQHWQDAQRRLQAALTEQSSLQKRQDELSWQLEQLAALDPKPGEWQQVSEEHARLSNGQALLEGAENALRALDDEESGAQRTVDRALSSLNHLLKHDAHLNDMVQALESASISIREARSDLARYLDAVDLDPERLNHMEVRMRALFDAARKFHCEPTDLPEVHQHLQESFKQLIQSQDLEALKSQVTAHEARFIQVAQQLHAKRTQASKTLSKSVTDMIRLLGMPDGRFAIEVETAPPGPSGADRITFLVAGHDSAELAPLVKVASGGELSRISLALSVIASQATRVPTLIFDEIDTGVSGAVAEKIGELLRQLGHSFQVLCVTHLAQVASCGHQHVVVTKQKDNQGVYSSAAPLEEPEARVDAIAQLLGGSTITATTREHAKEMLLRTHKAKV